MLTLLVALFVSWQVQAQQEPVPDTNVRVFPSDSAQAWLNKMSEAVKSLNYTISFVLLKPGVDAQPYLWRHGVNEAGVEMEQLNLLNGPGREVVRIGNRVSYFEPNIPPYSLESSIINGPFPSEFLQRPEKLMLAYEFILVGRSRIAGRAAQQIRMISKDKSRFGLNVWLDQESGLLLKMNLIGKEAELLEQIQITGLQITEEPDPFFTKIEPEMLPQVVSFRPSAPFNTKWKINFLPKGMTIIKRDMRRVSGLDEKVEYIMLSDGLVDVSVYLSDKKNGQVQSNLVGTLQSDTLLNIEHNELNITVIGKLPAATANAIAKSIQRIN
ncbi:MucB/RseB C-terminal domain-containing protein [uncultured Paraglaciecola sp.]|uniref:MucB/RseB C-terminal domain-containing protein n=1 Tax=uncultured Paraglaciecola sp. TaxID=1765024 RepID=UPI002614850A|nr:MucB/RseB C-terminal domain-containing protein [uncultured Paraglaciecola sp.]